MKNALLALLFAAGLAGVANAQVDVSINPVGILFSSIDLSAESGFGTDFGIEAAVGYDFQNWKFDDVKYRNNAFSTRLIGKYYFNPRDGRDRFHVGPYVRFSHGTATVSDENNSAEDVVNTKLAIGFYVGQKWVSRKNVIFELGLGMGRKLLRTYEYEDGTKASTDDIPLLNFDIFGRFSIGYRFGGGGSMDK